MFDFMFGGKRKLALIRELIEQRMQSLGIDDIEHRLKIKEMNKFELLGTPEATLVTIVGNVLKLQESGMFISQILESIEAQRRLFSKRQNISEFMEILNLASGTSEDAGAAIPIFCFYRMNVEHPNKMSEDQFMNAFIQAVKVLTGDGASKFRATQLPLTAIDSTTPSHDASIEPSNYRNQSEANAVETRIHLDSIRGEQVSEQDLYGITFDGEKYHYQQYRYDKLADAIAYAKLKLSREM